MKVMLTGATGFIGRQALAVLQARGLDVYAISAKPQADTQGLWHTVNLLDEESVKRWLQIHQPSHLLHLAWYVEHGKFWHAPENEPWQRASQHLYEQFISNGGTRAVLAGTCAEYKWGVGDGVCDEATTPTKPHTLYGQCKLALFESAWAYANKHHQSFAWGRVFFPYGVGEPLKNWCPPSYGRC